MNRIVRSASSVENSPAVVTMKAARPVDCPHARPASRSRSSHRTLEQDTRNAPSLERPPTWNLTRLPDRAASTGDNGSLRPQNLSRARWTSAKTRRPRPQPSEGAAADCAAADRATPCLPMQGLRSGSAGQHSPLPVCGSLNRVTSPRSAAMALAALFAKCACIRSFRETDKCYYVNYPHKTRRQHVFGLQSVGAPR